MKRTTKTSFWVILGAMALVSVPVVAEPVRRNTDVQVDSRGMDPFSSVNREKKDRFGFAIDDSVALGINDDGDPNLSMTF